MTREEKRRIVSDFYSIKEGEEITDEKTLNSIVDIWDELIYDLSPTGSKLNQLKDELKDIRREIERVEEECA
tara:strand:- start:536 stop:751 length:216 start_codon:yes stop_codon:yes gene_type:complete